MDTVVLCTVINGVFAVIVAALGYIVTRALKKLDRKDEYKKKESDLSLQMNFASMELSLACCNALTGGHNNGNVEDAKEKAREAKQKYLAFEREVLVKEIM